MIRFQLQVLAIYCRFLIVKVAKKGLVYHIFHTEFMDLCTHSMVDPYTNIFIKLYWREQPINLWKYINHRQIICRTVCSTPNVLYICTTSPSPLFLPAVRESSTHEQPFLISHTFEKCQKCQKCFMRLVSAQLVQSDARTGLIKAMAQGAKGSEGRRCVTACHGATICFRAWTLSQYLLPSMFPRIVCGRRHWCLSLRNQMTELKSVHH